jgi:hypothetical protein
MSIKRYINKFKEAFGLRESFGNVNVDVDTTVNTYSERITDNKTMLADKDLKKVMEDLYALELVNNYQNKGNFTQDTLNAVTAVVEQSQNNELSLTIATTANISAPVDFKQANTGSVTVTQLSQKTDEFFNNLTQQITFTEESDSLGSATNKFADALEQMGETDIANSLKNLTDNSRSGFKPHEAFILRTCGILKNSKERFLDANIGVNTTVNTTDINNAYNTYISNNLTSDERMTLSESISKTNNIMQEIISNINSTQTNDVKIAVDQKNKADIVLDGNINSSISISQSNDFSVACVLTAVAKTFSDTKMESASDILSMDSVQRSLESMTDLYTKQEASGSKKTEVTNDTENSKTSIIVYIIGAILIIIALKIIVSFFDNNRNEIISPTTNTETS